ncbi:CDP-glycerol glycerophosphotransferase family protein [Staphylococcus sp. IVB6227]
MLYNSKRAVKNNTIVFESFGGKSYSDNPKCIYEYMKLRYPQYKYYWVAQNSETFKSPNNLNIVVKNSRAYYNLYKKAHVWVLNSRLPLHMQKKENQLYIQTWHGTPLKRLANDMHKVRIPNTTTALYKKNFYRATRRWDYLISPNKYSTEIFRSAFWMDTDRILEVGYPRNDLLVNHQDDKILQQDIRQSLKIPDGKKVILYAPTWRDDDYFYVGSYKFELTLDLSKLQKSLGDNYVILLRMHYFIANRLDLSGLEGFAIDVSGHPDISELFLISDALITDYSSVMFDYGILKRPQFFFAYDIDKYNQELRGFYMNYHKDLPGPIYQTTDELLTGLQNMSEVAINYREQIESFHQRFCSFETGTASKFIGDFIHQHIESRK